MNFVEFQHCEGPTIHVNPVQVACVEDAHMRGDGNYTRLSMANGEVLVVKGYVLDVLNKLHNAEAL